MKSSIFLAASAAAFVIPDASVFNQVSLNDESINQKPVHRVHDSSSPSTREAWWNKVNTVADVEALPPVLGNAAERFAQVVNDAMDNFEHVIKGISHDVMELQDEFTTQLSSAVSKAKDALSNAAASSNGGGHHDFPDKTIYELIKLSSYTTKFAAIVDKHPSIVALLNSTSSDDKITLFAPIDEAFAKIPDDHEKPSEEFIENALLYHVGLGAWSARDIAKVRSVPTALKEEALGGEAQRLRTQIKFSGLTLNFYAKVAAVDIGASNGYVHAVKSLLLPPKNSGHELSLFPSIFSTLLLAMEKTDFISYVHALHFEGATIFAPWNRAFARLGIRVNAFLFNTEEGLGYLKAILKYHVAPNATLYTDAFYDKTGAGEDAESMMGHQHVELKTLLKGASVGVDIARWGIFSRMSVNGFAGVAVDDVPAKNAVIQTINRVLIPPHKHSSSAVEESDDEDEEMTVEELKERLADYL